MNLLITCSFCGVSRCDLDVVAVPKSMNVLLWSAAIGREALERFSGIRNPAMCREHFHISCIDTAGKLVEDAVPITLEEWQLEEINNRLNDHCYTTFHNSSEIYKISKRLLDDMKSTICMLCDREIPRKTLYVHATMHSTKPVKTECPCKYHENEKHLFHSLSKVDVERCKECRFEFRKENQTRALNRMKRCFPLFDSSTKVSTRITNFGEEKFLSVSNVPPKRYLKQREARLRIMMNSQEKVVHDGSESAPKWMNINARSSNGGEQKKKTKKAKPKAKPKKVEHENGLLNTLFPEVKQEVLDDEFQFIKQEVDDGGYGEEQPEETNFYDDDDFDLFADDDVPMVDRASDEDFNPDAGNESDSSDDAGVSNDHEEEEEEEKSVARQQTHQEKVEQNLRFAHYFKEESHPSAGKLFEISQIERKTFANCYRIFEAMRKQLGIDCQKDDSCFQIANYFVLESEQPPPPPTVDKEAEIILRDAENEALHKGLFVTSGLIYSICEKTGLHPHFVRRRMRTFLKIRRKSQKTKEMLEQWDGENKGVNCSLLNSMHVKLRESAGHNNRLPKESVERLEEEFEQSRDLIKDRVVRLSKELQLSQTTIRLWWGRQIVKREKYGPGEVKVIEKRHTFTQEEKDYLQTEFEKNNYPSAEEYREYAKHLGLTLANIKYFFNTRRTELRKKKELEIVKDQFDKIEKEKVERLEEVLEEMKGKRVLFKTRVELAKQLELSYQLVTYWFETKMEERTRERKMQMTRKRKIKKEEELEMEGEDEDDARNMEEDADSSDDDEADTGYM